MSFPNSQHKDYNTPQHKGHNTPQHKGHNTPQHKGHNTWLQLAGLAQFCCWF